MMATAMPDTGGRAAPFTPHATKRQLVREIVNVIADLPRFVAAPLYRRWHQRWGATQHEVASPMPGDSLVTGAQYQATRAITIAAPSRRGLAVARPGGLPSRRLVQQ
jgi:hypothetical protein